jgi:hypothetical protein
VSAQRPTRAERLRDHRREFLADDCLLELLGTFDRELALAHARRLFPGSSYFALKRAYAFGGAIEEVWPR